MNLNNRMRDKIILNILEYSFGTRQKSLERRTGKLADAVYRHVMGKYQIQLSKIPEKFIKKSTSMGLRFGGSHVYLYFAEYDPIKGPRHYGDLKGRPWADETFSFDAAHNLAVRWRALESGFIIVNEEREAMRAEVAASLRAVRTVERLVEQWPGARKFFPEDLTQYKPPVPAKIPGNDLDSMIKKAQAVPVGKDA